MRIPGHFSEAHHRFHAGVQLPEYLCPRLPASGPEDLPEGILHFPDPFLCPQQLSVPPLRLSQTVAERRKEFRFQGTDAHVPPIRCLIKIVDLPAVQESVLPGGLRASRKEGSAVHGVEGDHAVLHGDIDELALSRLLTVKERRQDRSHRSHGAAGHIRDLEVVETGTAKLPPRRIRDAGARQVIDVMACSL